MRPPVAIAAWCAACAVHAAPASPLDACFVRVDAAAPAATDVAASSVAAASAPPTQSHVGLRRKTEQLFALDVSVAGPDAAVCRLTGTARLRGDPAEILAMVVRPDPGRKTGRTGTLCQVFVRLTPDGITLATTPSSCQAQSLCEGRVELDGQRFDATSRLPAGARGPCFATPSP